MYNILLIDQSMRRLSACILAIAIFGNITESQTCIVVGVKENIIYIGADSKVRINGVPSATPYCKIRHVSSFVYSYCGIAEWIGTPFAIDSIVRAESQKGSTVIDKLTSIEEALGTTLANVIEDHRARGLPISDTMLKKSCRVVFVWFQDDTAHARITRFVPFVDSSSHTAVRTTTIQYKYDDQGRYAVLGEVGGIPRLEQEDPTATAGDPIGVINKLIAAVIETNPDSVGPPIDILKITKDGSQWIQRKAECQDF